MWHAIHCNISDKPCMEKIDLAIHSPDERSNRLRKDGHIMPHFITNALSKNLFATYVSACKSLILQAINPYTKSGAGFTQ